MPVAPVTAVRVSPTRPTPEIDGLALTTISKTSLSEAPPDERAVTSTFVLPTSLNVGMPVKVAVDAVKVSQEGSAL